MNNTPPDDLIREWWSTAQDEFDQLITCATYVADQAAAWGYKQRLIEEDRLLMQIVPPDYFVPEDRLSRPCGGKGGFDDFVERWH